MSDFRVIGIDPGPTPGIVVLDVVRQADEPGRILRAEVVQCSAGLLELVVWALVVDRTGGAYRVAAERFVNKGRANPAQSLTRDQVGSLGKYELTLRSAAMVKPWATDARLEAAGLLEAVKGMRHARDAARHALFCAVQDAGVPDPLSKEFHR